MEFIKLEKGKLLDVQVGFVDSWNRMVDCWNNLSGEGKAEVLWSTENHPVVKVEDTESPYNGDNDDDDEEPEELPDIILPPYIPNGPEQSTNGCYEIESITPSGISVIIVFSNTYYSVGGQVIQGPSSVGTNTFPCVVSLTIDSTDGNAVLKVFPTMQELINDNGNLSKYNIPLYSFTSEQKKAVDFRNMPRASMGEF